MFPDYLIFDFDSTFITGELLEEFARITLRNHPNSWEHLAEINELTHAGMEGKIPFDESLSRRMRLLEGSKQDVQEVTEVLKKQITPSIERNKKFIHNNAQNIFILSGGFKEIIVPVVSEYGILDEHIFANDFIYDSDDAIIKVDPKNIMATGKGKVAQAKVLNFSGDVHVIGDGFTDYQVKSEGPETSFFAYIENVKRNNVCDVADIILNNFDDYISYLMD